IPVCAVLHFSGQRQSRKTDGRSFSLMALQSHFKRWLDNAYPTRSIDLVSTKEVIHILTARKDEK
ncbi:hypothetical protein J8997_29765, partial [Klebsiella quasipneumoniae subsp. quasipneumoniae]|uniref:hypothetical protein n=2 Tax=Klebsiella quasipneumoniae TaxID=1463165 RepID=UPI002F96399C